MIHVVFSHPCYKDRFVATSFMSNFMCLTVSAGEIWAKQKAFSGYSCSLHLKGKFPCLMSSKT